MLHNSYYKDHELIHVKVEKQYLACNNSSEYGVTSIGSMRAGTLSASLTTTSLGHSIMFGT